MDTTSFFINKKVRLTEGRRIVFSFIEGAKRPIDSGLIIQSLGHKYHINRATIFRILNLLTEKGILRKIDFSDGKARYEVFNNDHHHFVCQNCQKIEKVTDCPVGKIEKQLKKKGFLVKKHSLEFFGLCPNCIN